MIDFFQLHWFLISQILVGIAIITDAMSFQFKNRKVVLLLLTTSALLITIHYLFLWEINAFYMMALSTMSFLISSFTHNKKIMWVFFILYLFPILLNYSSPYDIILFIGLYIALIAKFMKKDKVLRVLFMIATLFSITFNLLIFTPTGVLLEVLFLTTNLVWYYRHYLKK